MSVFLNIREERWRQHVTEGMAAPVVPDTELHRHQLLFKQMLSSKRLGLLFGIGAV